MGETARRTFIATIVVVAVVVATLALWELRILIALIFLGLVLAAAMRPGIDALARAPDPTTARSGAPLPRHRRSPCPAALARRPRGSRSDRPGDRRRAHLEGGTRAANEALERAEARDPRRGPEVAGQPPVRRRALPRRRLARDQGVRGPHRHLLHLRHRCLLDLRARPDDAARPLGRATGAPPRDPRHLGTDRREARGVRSWPTAADRLRGDRALALLLGDRRPVLAPARRLCRNRRDRPGDRAASRREHWRSASA